MVQNSDSAASKLDIVRRFNNAASVYAAVLFLLYILLYAIACPRRELLLAAGCELLFFVVLCVWRYTRSKSADTRAKDAVVAQLTDEIRPLAAANSVYQYSFMAGWLIVCVLATLDFASLTLAFAGNLKASELLYVNVPTMRLIGAHAGATAEILSGAYMSAGKPAAAEKLYGLIGDVRRKVYGPNSESSVGLLADYGDLYASQKRYSEAIPYYENSIAMSRKIRGATGYGRPLTGLANCFRELRQFGKAEGLYQEAIAMRSRLYGPRSEKVGATLKEYAELLRQVGRNDESSALLEKARLIDSLQKKDDNNPIPTLCLMAAVFMASFYLLGRKGVLTRLATKKLQERVKNSTMPDAVDLKRLSVLLNYQGLKADEQSTREKMRG